MPLSTNSTSEVLPSSTDDMGSYQSDMESSSSSVSFDESTPKDYWFGRKYFECIIAEHLLKRSKFNVSVAQIDSQLERLIQGFPHSQILHELREQGLEQILPVVDPSENGAYRALMFCVGAVVRTGNRKHREALFSVVRQHLLRSDSTRSFRSQSKNTTENYSTPRVSYPRKSPAHEETSPLADTGRYVTALQHYTDQRKDLIDPAYEAVEVSKGSPLFRASVTVDGVLYEAVAKTKKQARHKAAKQACLKMEIEA